MSVFRYNDYRDAIAGQIEISKKSEKKLSYSDMAENIRVQKGYVTRVFKKEAHFSSDQLFLACEYLNLNNEESNYLMLLLELGRSALAQRKKELQKQINDIQRTHRDTRKHLKADMLNPIGLDDYNRYYLDPMVPLVHTFLSVPAFSRNLKIVATKLGISEKRLKSIVKTLEDLQIVKLDSASGAYLIIRDHMQLVADSPLNLPYQIFQRTNAINKIQTQNIEDRFVFSVAFSADQKTKNEIHEAFLKFLRKAETLVKEGSPTDIYQMNFDLFGWV